VKGKKGDEGNERRQRRREGFPFLLFRLTLHDSDIETKTRIGESTNRHGSIAPRRTTLASPKESVSSSSCFASVRNSRTLCLELEATGLATTTTDLLDVREERESVRERGKGGRKDEPRSCPWR
jgi:hypothetical protein